MIRLMQRAGCSSPPPTTLLRAPAAVDGRLEKPLRHFRAALDSEPLGLSVELVFGHISCDSCHKGSPPSARPPTPGRQPQTRGLRAWRIGQLVMHVGPAPERRERCGVTQPRLSFRPGWHHRSGARVGRPGRASTRIPALAGGAKPEKVPLPFEPLTIEGSCDFPVAVDALQNKAKGLAFANGVSASPASSSSGSPTPRAEKRSI
jgi:hypothetical protein